MRYRKRSSRSESMRGKSHHSCERWPKTTPMRLASSLRWRRGLSPATLTVPPLGWRMPVSILMVVDLPAPFGPINPIISPRSISSERSCTALTIRTWGFTTLRKPLSTPGRLFAIRNDLLRPLASIMVSIGNTSFAEYLTLFVSPFTNPAHIFSLCLAISLHLTPCTLISPYAKSPDPHRDAGETQSNNWRKKCDPYRQPQRQWHVKQVTCREKRAKSQGNHEQQKTLQRLVIDGDGVAQHLAPAIVQAARQFGGLDRPE